MSTPDHGAAGARVPDRADDRDRALEDAAESGDEAYDEMIAAHEERLAAARMSAIEAGRRKGGVAGAAMAGAMLAVAEIYEGPKKDDAPVTVEASGKPHDLEKDGFGGTFGEVDVAAPALARVEPIVKRRRRR